MNRLFEDDFCLTRVSGFWQTLLAKIFGTRFYSVDEIYQISGSVYKGKWYITKMERR